jgi:hypothetical protein
MSDTNGHVNRFVPVNELEDALVRVYSDQSQLGVFAMKLFASRVVVLSRQEPGKPRGEPIALLVIRGASGVPALAVFTSLDRTAPWIKRAGEYRHAATVDAASVLRSAPPGCGVAINPGWAFGLEVPAAGLRRLVSDFGGSGV